MFGGEGFDFGVELAEVAINGHRLDLERAGVGQNQGGQQPPGPDGALDRVAAPHVFEGLGFSEQIDSYRHRSESREGGADGDGELGGDLVNLAGLLRGQGQFQEADGVPGFALDHQLGLKNLHDEFRAGGGAGEVNVRNGLVLLMFEKVNRSPQLATQGHDERFEVGLDLGGHANFDAFRLGITDAQGLGQAVGKPVPADTADTAEHQLPGLEQTNAGVLESHVHQFDNFLRKDFSHAQF